MKRFIILALISLSILYSYAQCGQDFVYECATKNINNGIYLRDFNPKKKKNVDVAKFDVLLKQGTHYRFIICTTSEHQNKAFFKLYDKRKLVGTTFHKNEKAEVINKLTNEMDSTKYFIDSKGDLYTEYFDFICLKTKNYWLTINYSENIEDENFCAVGLLLFVEKTFENN